MKKSNTKFLPQQSANATTTTTTTRRPSPDSASASAASAFVGRTGPLPSAAAIRAMPPNGGRPSPPALPPPAFFGATNFRRGPPPPGAFDPSFRPYPPPTGGPPPPFAGRTAAAPPNGPGDRRAPSASGASAPQPPHGYAPHHSRGPPPHPSFDGRQPAGAPAPGPPSFAPDVAPRFYPPTHGPRMAGQPPFGPAPHEQVLRPAPSSGSTESGNSSQSAASKQQSGSKANTTVMSSAQTSGSAPNRTKPALPQRQNKGTGGSGPASFRPAFPHVPPPHGVGGPPPPHYPPYGRWGGAPHPPPQKSRGVSYGEYMKGKTPPPPSGGPGSGVAGSGPYTTALQEGGGLIAKRKENGMPGSKMPKLPPPHHRHPTNGMRVDPMMDDSSKYGGVILPAGGGAVDSREGATSPSQIDLNRRDDVSNMGCTCKKSKCLKLYCQCFAASMTCGPNCRCIMCNNQGMYEAVRKEAVRQILQRNPSAFDTKFKKTHDDTTPTSSSSVASAIPTTSITVAPATVAHKLGCKCRKSFCTKKYCECYNAGVKCSQNCRCIGCKNMPMGGSSGGRGASSMASPNRPGAMGLRHEYNTMMARMEAPNAWMDAAHNLAFMKHSTPPRPAPSPAGVGHRPRPRHPPPPHHPHHRHPPPSSHPMHRQIPPPPLPPSRRDPHARSAGPVPPPPIPPMHPPSLVNSSTTTSPADESSRTRSSSTSTAASNEKDGKDSGAGVNSLLLAAVAMTELCNGTAPSKATSSSSSSNASPEQRPAPAPPLSSSEATATTHRSPSKRKSIEKTISKDGNTNMALDSLLSLATAATSTSNPSNLSASTALETTSSAQPLLTPRDRVKRTRVGTMDRTTRVNTSNTKHFDMTPRVSSTSKGDSSSEDEAEENSSKAGGSGCHSVSDENSTPEKPVIGMLRPSYNYGTPSQLKKNGESTASSTMTPVSARCIDFQHMGVSDRGSRRRSNHGEEDEEKKEDTEPMDMVVTRTVSSLSSSPNMLRPTSAASSAVATGVPMMTTSQQ